MTPERKYLVCGILTVIGGMLIQFAFGHFYTIANMAPYIRRYLRNTSEPNLKDSSTVWLSGLGYGGQGLTMPLGGYIARKIDYRIVIAIGCLVNSGSILLTYFSVKNSFAAVVTTYAVFNGVGLGFAYSVVMEITGSYFPEHRGLVVGIVVGGYGLSAVFFTPIQTAFIKSSDDEGDGNPNVPKTFLLMGGLLLAFQTIGLCLMRARPKPVSNDDDDETSSLKEDNNLSLRQMFHRLDFYLLWFTLGLMIIPISIFIPRFKGFGEYMDMDDDFLTTVVTLTALFNWIGRVVWGELNDKISFKFPLCIMMVCFSILLFTFPHFKNLSGDGLKAIYTIWGFLMFFCLSATFVLLPAAVGCLFGPVKLALNYGILFSATFVGSIIISGILTAIDKEDAYVEDFSAAGAICLAALCVFIWVSDPKMPRKINWCRWCSTRCNRDDE